MDPLERFERLARAARRDSPLQLDVTRAVIERLRSEAPGASSPAPLSGQARRSRGWRMLRRLGAWAVAAGILVAAGIWFSRTSPNTAYAALDRVIVATETSQDRSYRVIIHRARGLRREVAARLDVRGGDRFVLQHPAPLLGDVVIGCNGHQCWVVPGFGPVFVNDDPETVSRWLAGRDVSIPFLHVRSILGWLQDRYDLELHNADGRDEIVGQRREPHDRWPQRIEVWADSRTGVATRMLLDWEGQDRGRRPNRVELELLDDERLPDDWYEHTAHHDAPRSVRQLNEPPDPPPSSGPISEDIRQE